MRWIALLLATAILSGCGENLYVEIEADGPWLGAFGDRSVAGRGDRRVDVDDARPQCAVVQKQESVGMLTARMVCEKRGLSRIFGSSGTESTATTIAPYGVVVVCSKD